ncbi:hypothetical protein Ancab_014886 [Ancistrocladus abbreviatus]
MDEDMEESDVQIFEVVEIDLDYEFDAARFFDFSRPETEAEAREADSWFEAAQSYPPSPFVTKLFWRENEVPDNVNTSSKSKCEDMLALEGYTNAHDTEIAEKDETCGASCRGLTFYDRYMREMRKTKSESIGKPPQQRSSTLMKPTASQLAKQNQRQQFGDYRFQKLSVQKNKGSSNVHCGAEIQASKRQKLDGGCLHKVGDKQQSNLVHKVPKKNETTCGVVSQTKLKLTIPLEPELETAHRAQRIRSTSSKQVENATTITTRFKARPLNRKLFEAPALPVQKRNPPCLPEFQVFHLKTMERAMRHTAPVVLSSIQQADKGRNRSRANFTVENGNKDDKRLDSVDDTRQDEQREVHYFKARPLDRKIFTSKGNIGVFKNIKRDITVPKEFNFQTEKRIQHDPPVELFSKLSLASEVQRISTQMKTPQPTCLPSKGSKENRWSSFHQDYNIKLCGKEKPIVFDGKKTQRIGDIGIGRIGH